MASNYPLLGRIGGGSRWLARETPLQLLLLALRGSPEPLLHAADGVGDWRERVGVGAVIGREEERGGQRRGRDGDVAKQAVLSARIHRPSLNSSSVPPRFHHNLATQPPALQANSQTDLTSQATKKSFCLPKCCSVAILPS